MYNMMFMEETVPFKHLSSWFKRSHSHSCLCLGDIFTELFYFKFCILVTPCSWGPCKWQVLGLHYLAFISFLSSFVLFLSNATNQTMSHSKNIFWILQMWLLQYSALGHRFWTLPCTHTVVQAVEPLHKMKYSRGEAICYHRVSLRYFMFK